MHNSSLVSTFGTQYTKARVLAYYLPQFHPIPENDKWWGKGFTEWTNVGKAKPLFPGHYQPHVPADLGYYDLRVPETRQAQADLAREYGIEGFVYWHYWFGNGKRLLERPFNEVLASGQPDFPFALAWANETWSGSFHGLKDGKVLIEQTYPGDEDYTAHFNTVLPAFRDHRYITCEGRPVFFVYHPHEVPDMGHFIDLWQQLAIKNGLRGIYFVAIQQSLFTAEETNAAYKKMKSFGFAAINVINSYNAPIKDFKVKLMRKIFFKWLKLIPNLIPYRADMIDSCLDELIDVMPTVMPNWDHTPRTGKRGVVLYGSTPDKFRESVHRMLIKIKHKPYDHRFLMVKSWNEWAEGNYLEPDLQYGRQYLEALGSEILEDNE